MMQTRDGIIRILLYSNGGGLKRSVTLSPAAGNPYSAVKLEARQLVPYQLVMTLIEAETVKDQPR